MSDVICNLCKKEFKVNERHPVFDKEGKAYHFRCMKAINSNISSKEKVNMLLTEIQTLTKYMYTIDIVKQNNLPDKWLIDYDSVIKIINKYSNL